MSPLNNVLVWVGSRMTEGRASRLILFYCDTTVLLTSANMNFSVMEVSCLKLSSTFIKFEVKHCLNTSGLIYKTVLDVKDLLTLKLELRWHCASVKHSEN